MGIRSKIRLYIRAYREGFNLKEMAMFFGNVLPDNWIGTEIYLKSQEVKKHDRLLREKEKRDKKAMKDKYPSIFDRFKKKK